MKLFCVGHKPPVFAPRAEFTHVSPFVYPDLTQIIVKDDTYGENFHGSILSEYTQLFGLADHLENAPEDELFYIFQYRKFISLRPGNNKAINVSYAYACPQEEANALFPSQTELASTGERLLTGPAVKLRSLAHDYSLRHLAEDFAAFSISLSTVDGFDALRCKTFINCEVLIPAPSLGTSRVDIFLRHVKIMRAAWGHFSENFLVNRADYQRRVGGFLLERLHSFLLYETITSKTIAASRGVQIVVSDSPSIKPTI